MWLRFLRSFRYIDAQSLTLVVLKEENYKYICLLHQSEKRRNYMKSFCLEYAGSFSMHKLYHHGCWWPDDAEVRVLTAISLTYFAQNISVSSG